MICATQARNLRTKLFSQYFEGVVGHDREDLEGGLENSLGFSIAKLKLRNSCAKEILDFDSVSWDSKSCYMSPWKILQCYLESLFQVWVPLHIYVLILSYHAYDLMFSYRVQVGIIHEMLGDGDEAEIELKRGKVLSNKLDFKVFEVSFSLILGMK